MATSAQKSDHVTKVRQAATRLMDVIKELNGLRVDWDALGLSAELTNDDCQGNIVADISAVYTSHAAINALLAQGHNTNLTKVRIG
jgi:hypothetical protein